MLNTKTSRQSRRLLVIAAGTRGRLRHALGVRLTAFTLSARRSLRLLPFLLLLLHHLVAGAV